MELGLGLGLGLGSGLGWGLVWGLGSGSGLGMGLGAKARCEAGDPLKLEHVDERSRGDIDLLVSAQPW